jgi:hypothetical protein
MPHGPGQHNDHNFGALVGRATSGVTQGMIDHGGASDARRMEVA